MTNDAKPRYGVLLAGILYLGSPLADAHALAVDLDLGTPGIQSALDAAPGTILTVGLVLIDDGVSAMSGFGIALNFNDNPVLALASPTIAGPFAGSMTDLVSNTGTDPLIPLTTAGVAPFGTGPGGSFAASDGGAGYYDSIGAPLAVGFFGEGAGTEVLLSTIDLVVVGSVGSSTELVPQGILPAGGGPSAPADPKVAGSLTSGGVSFWDGGDFSMGPGGYAAAPVGASALPDAINPASLTVIIPEPGTSLLLGLGVAALLRRRRN